jgi:hypothetical protein
MKLLLCFLLLLSLSIITSCSVDKKKQEKLASAELKSFLFRTEYFISNNEQNLSFPNWFNDKLVAKQNIQKISHSWYNAADEEGESPVLQKMRIYTFTESGTLLAFQQKRFYENLEVENITFRYADELDEMGFAEVTAVDSLYPDESLEYTTYRKEEYQDAYAVYENNNNGDFLFCLLKKRFQGIVSVDSLFAPTPDDIIQYGKPVKPYKQYQIENLVEENNVKRYGYFKKSTELQYQISDNYPFLNKSRITVDKKGKCTGFIDSTFSTNEFLNRTVSTFSFDEKNLPSRLTHTGMRNGKFETFEYTFFP